MDPFSASAVFACINTAFKFAEYAIRVAEVGTENEVFVRTIQVVRNDLNEAERLLGVSSVHAKLVSVPQKLQWIKGAIHSTKSALNEIGRWVERARGEHHATGSVKFETRVRWVFNDHEKLVNRQTELSMCHQQLSNVLNYLIPMEEAVATVEPPTYTDTMYFEDLISPRQRKASTVPVAGETASRKDEKRTEPGTFSAPTKHSQCSTGTPPAPVANSFSGNSDSSLQDISPANSAFNPTSSTHFQTTQPVASDPLIPPCSPPPAYASILPVGNYTEMTGRSGYLADLKQDVTTCATTVPPYGTNPVCTDSKRANPATESKTTKVWAYEHNQPERGVPELYGDTVSLSATNSQGPVNPFEMFAEPTLLSQKSTTALNSKANTISNLTEVMGNVSFTAELPANNPAPGPPPGYPRGSKREFAVELPSIAPKRRPVPTHSQSAPLGSIQELPALYPLTQQNAVNCQELPAADSNPPNYGQARSELPAPDSDPSYFNRRRSELPATTSTPYFAHQNSSPTSAQWAQSASSSSVSLPSTSTYFSGPLSSATSPLSSPTSPSATPFGTQRVVSPLGTPAAPMRPSVPRRSETTASARMQSQRALMDMLGTIDQS